MEKLKKLWNLCGGHLFLILCGAVLVLFPNSAVALVTKLLAWILIVIGVHHGLKLLSGHREGKLWFFAIGGFLVGGYLLVNPLTISDLVGRILGTLLMIQGLNDLRKSRYDSAKFLGGLTVAAGLLLVMIPRTLVNTLLAVVGIALIIIGLINCADKLRHGNRISDGSDPNIIDADE